MATRTQARSAVISLLYAIELDNRDVLAQSEEILEERRIRHKQREFAYSLLLGVIEHKEVLDKLIQSKLKDWDIGRIGKVEICILRLGAYEIIYHKLDRAIAINEAIELAKLYSDENAPRLINGVLDALANEESKEKLSIRAQKESEGQNLPQSKN